MKFISENLTENLTWIHWLILLLSLIITIFSWDYSRSQNIEKLELRFNFQSEQLINLVSERMEHYEDALRSGAALFYSQNNKVDFNTWRRFASSLDIENKYRGIAGIGIIYYVSPDKKETFIENQKKIRPYFRIHPQHEKNELWPITYIEPEKNNIKALGLDIAFENNRLSASKASRDTGKTNITAPIILVQDSKSTPGFLQFLPIYSKQNITTVAERKKYFIGHVYAPFIMERLIEGTLNINKRMISFSVHDESRMLIDELQSNELDYDPEPMFSKEVEVDFYGRPWTFKIQTGLEFRQSGDKNQSTFILVVGILIDFMFFVLFIILTRSNKISIELAKKLSSSEEYYRYVIESAPCGIMIIGAAGGVERVNQKLCEIFSYNENELIDMPVEELLPHEERNKLMDFKDSPLSNAERVIVENSNVLAKSKCGDVFPIEVGVASVSIDGESKVIVSVVDITAYTKVVSELQRSNKELDDFAYVASHDLKAPLRGIIQLSNWIKEDIEGVVNEDTHINLALLNNRAIRLEKLLDDLLSYSRVGRVVDNKQKVDINDLITNIFTLLDPEKGIKLEVVGVLPVIETLQVPLELVFRNLIGNAIKHHDKPHGVIRVSVVESSQQYEFTVEDDGPGIESKHHNQIFKLFKTLKPRDEVEGSGMGLSIIKKILAYYNQDITVISDGKSGTQFIFSWPKIIGPKQ